MPTTTYTAGVRPTLYDVNYVRRTVYVVHYTWYSMRHIVCVHYTSYSMRTVSIQYTTYSMRTLYDYSMGTVCVHSAWALNDELLKYTV